MNLIVANIERLLRDGCGCVALPGLGAVVARPVAARFDADRGLMLPPGVEYAFNAAVFEDGATLARSVARHARLSFEAASFLVDDFVAEVRRTLSSGSVASLGRIGSLVNGENGKLRFIPLAHCFTPADFLWLEPAEVRASSRRHELSNSSFEEDTDFANKVSQAWRESVRRGARIAAGVALFIAAAFCVALTLDRTLPEGREEAGIGAGMTNPIEILKSSNTLPGEKRAPAVLVLHKFADAVTEVDTVKELRTEVEMSQENDEYFFVVASLASQAQAERFIREHGGDDAGLRIKDCDSRFRVYALAGSSREYVEEKAAAEGFNQKYPEAWICRYK